MNWKTRFLFIVLLFPSIYLSGQRTYRTIVRDTIVTKSVFLGKAYLLDGKKLTLPVMQWFMSDHPSAYDKIQVSGITNQLSLASLTIGGIFTLTGVLANSENESLGEDLLTIGGIGLGSGLIFQLISGSYKKGAVRAYNEEIKLIYANQQTSLKWELSDDGIGLRLGF